MPTAGEDPGRHGQPRNRRAVTPAPPPFNANFYVVAATVIPVLFLAIAVQGRLYEDLLKTSSGAYQRFRQRYRAGATRPALAAYGASLMVMSIAILILIYGAADEIRALLALYHQRPEDPGYVLIASVFLTAAAAAGPALALVRFMFALWPKRTRHETHPAAEARALAQESGQPSQRPGATPEPETGKTGTA